MNENPSEGCTPRPVCPFCGAVWTADMLGRYDAMVDHGGCCGPGSGADHRDHKPRVIPIEDLCCASCGKPIFRAPGSL